MPTQKVQRGPRAIPVFVVNPVSEKDMGEPDVQAVVIPAGATGLSGAIVLTGSLQRIVVPANWTAADLTFQTSYDGQNFSNLYDSYGGEYTVKAAASREIILNPADFVGLRNLKIRSGTNAVPVNQVNAPTLQLVQLP